MPLIVAPRVHRFRPRSHSLPSYPSSGHLRLEPSSFAPALATRVQQHYDIEPYCPRFGATSAHVHGHGHGNYGDRHLGLDRVQGGTRRRGTRAPSFHGFSPSTDLLELRAERDAARYGSRFHHDRSSGPRGGLGGRTRHGHHRYIGLAPTSSRPSTDSGFSLPPVTWVHQDMLYRGGHRHSRDHHRDPKCGFCRVDCDKSTRLLLSSLGRRIERRQLLKKEWKEVSAVCWEKLRMKLPAPTLHRSSHTLHHSILSFLRSPCPPTISATLLMAFEEERARLGEDEICLKAAIEDAEAILMRNRRLMKGVRAQREWF